MKLGTYEEWKQSITLLCGVSLKPDYIEKRLEELNDRQNDHTKKFINAWGEQHLQQVIKWFERAKQEFK